jgi:ABC-type cobalamin/Fe3+-siderophores transport system ATPase subunit
LDPAPRQDGGFLVDILHIDQLTVAYGEKTVLREVSLDVTGGEVLGLVGPNGAGKSTLIRAASGVIKILSGRITFNGTDLVHLTSMERARILAVVPQARQLGGAFTVEQTVLLGRSPHINWLGKAGKEDHLLAEQAMQQTFTLDLARRHVAELSGGEQQRVLLARALAQSTPVLMLDEPTNHLDLHHQVEFLRLVRRLADQEGLAVMMAMHDLNLVSRYADRAALLVDGIVQASGTPEEVLTLPNLSSAYQASLSILKHPRTGKPIILTDGE